MIPEYIKKYNLKQLDFLQYADLTKTKLFYALKKNDPVYIKGLNKTFGEYLKWKTRQLEKVTQEYNKNL